ncbi:hypothetical protein [Saccharopolyspora sp. 5N708]|uniref:hypothetical protein n=1 Tax=Saccharopolyspora sp. 5N708 TaxID=3457424 RepID=UPI003FD06232
MPAEHPDQLRRWWWKSPLAARLLPAVALLAATGAGVVGAMPDAGGHGIANPPHPPQAPVGYLTPTNTTPTTTTTTTATTEPEPTTIPTSTPTTSRPPTTTTTSTSTTTTSRQTRPPRPTSTDTDERPRPTTNPHDDWVPVVTEGDRCSREGDFARTPDGAAASCRRADDGKLRWTTQW